MRSANKSAMFFLLTVLLALPVILFSNTKVFANTVQVYKDGIELSYTDAKPQIINDRTMVPLAETASYFGMTYVWNSETATMIFTGNGRTMIHTVYDNTIYVNGTPVEFDFTSVIVNSRTLMPIRMLAEAIGCAVEWDSTGIVDIWTDTTGTSQNNPDTSQQAGQYQDNTSPQPSSSSGGAITIYSATKDKASVEQGQAITITVATTKAASKAKVTDVYGDELEEVTNFEEDSQGRYFTIQFTPEEIGEITYRVYAGDDDGYSLSTKEVTVVINEKVKTIIIEGIKLDNKSVSSRDEVAGVFYTSRNVKKVIIEDSKGKTVKTISRYSSSTSSAYQWDFYFYAEPDSGSYTYNIVAYDSNNDSEKESFTFTVKGSGSSSGNSSSTVEIVKMQYDNITDYDERFYITVTTNKSVVEVEILDKGDKLMASESKYKTSGSNRVWELYFYPEDSGRYYVYAYGDDEDDQVYESISIDVR